MYLSCHEQVRMVCLVWRNLHQEIGLLEDLQYISPPLYKHLLTPYPEIKH